jgi:hypothetical protein
MSFQDFIIKQGKDKDMDISFGSVKNLKKKERLEGCKLPSKKAKKEELVKVSLSLYITYRLIHNVIQYLYNFPIHSD